MQACAPGRWVHTGLRAHGRNAYGCLRALTGAYGRLRGLTGALRALTGAYGRITGATSTGATFYGLTGAPYSVIHKKLFRAYLYY